MHFSETSRTHHIVELVLSHGHCALDIEDMGVLVGNQVGVHLTRSVIGNLLPSYSYRRHPPGAGWAGITKGETWCCFLGSWHTEVPSPGIAAFNGCAAQAKSVRFESTGPSLLVLIHVAQWGCKGWEFDRQRCTDYSAICCSILKASRCLIYNLDLACRPFDTTFLFKKKDGSEPLWRFFLDG